MNRRRALKVLTCLPMNWWMTPFAQPSFDLVLSSLIAGARCTARLLRRP